MKKAKISISDRILDQLEMIEKINQLIEISKKMESPLMVRQHEHLKKEYTKNLFKMLKESYQITIPVIKEAA